MSTPWPTVALGDVVTDIQPGFASGKHNSEGNGLPHFRPMNVSSDGRINRSVMKFVEATAVRPDIRLRRGDILFNNTNSPELVGKTALFDDDDSPAYSNHMTRLRVDASRMDARYAALRLHQAWREGWFAAHCNNHVSQASIGREVLKGFMVELPPLDVQRAIALLGSKLDGAQSSATQHLHAARRAVDGFRGVILAAACSGRLTEDWREAHTDAVSVEYAIDELAATKRKRAKVDESPHDLQLPELPVTYVVGTIGAAAERIEYGTSKRAESDIDGIAVLRMGNIQGGALDVTDLKYCHPDAEIERLMLHDGDLLFNRTNSPELVGKAAVFHEDHAAMTFASYLIRVRFDQRIADPDFINYWINSAWGRIWARQVKTDGVSQSNINGTKLAAMPVPLPPIDEQREIVRRAGGMLKLADELMLRINTAARAVEMSGQAVLARAFRGDILA